MDGNMTPIEALRPPSNVGFRLCMVPAPGGLSSEHLTGRAGQLKHGRRRLVYLRRGRRVVWFEWQDGQVVFPFMRSCEKCGSDLAERLVDRAIDVLEG